MISQAAREAREYVARMTDEELAATLDRQLSPRVRAAAVAETRARAEKAA